jgi:hypothetical protein
MSKINLSRVLRPLSILNAGNSKNQLPDTRQDRSGQVRRSGIGLRDRKPTLVSSTPTSKPLPIKQAKINRGLSLMARVGKVHSNSHYALLNLKRNLNIALTILIRDGPMQNQVWFLSKTRPCRRGTNAYQYEPFQPGLRKSLHPCWKSFSHSHRFYLPDNILRAERNSSNNPRSHQSAGADGRPA